MADRVRREFSDADIAQISETYHRWRSTPEALEERGLEAYKDVAGFCKSADLELIRKYDHVLTPGRYVGAAEVEDDGVPFEQKFAALRATLEGQFMEGAKLESQIKATFDRVPQQ